MPRLLLLLLSCLLASLVAADVAPQQAAPVTATSNVTTTPPSATSTTTESTERTESTESVASNAVPASTPVVAKGPVVTTGLGSGVSETSPLTVLLGLGFILALIFGSAWLMRRMGAMNFSGQSGLKVLTGLSVGPRERVLLIEAGDKQILIGVASGSVSHLQTFEQPIIHNDGKASGDFSQRLRSMLASGRSDAGGIRR